MPQIIKERLFTPGPTPLLMEGQARTLTATLHHRTEAFKQLMNETLENLRYFFNTKNDVLMFSSSGTGAMEGSIANLTSPGERVLVCTAGKFGERWVELASAYGLETVKVEAPYGQPLSVAEIGKCLKNDGPFRAVYVQATETSTGVSHDVKAISDLVRPLPETCLVVDGITGLGTTDLRPDEWGLDVVIGGSQKALMVPPGLAFASVSEKAWKLIGKSKSPRYYFDFAKERKNLAKGQSSYTPATTLVVGLHATLQYIREVGRENLIANAAMLAKATREAAKAMGLSLFATDSPANAVTAIKAPDGMDSGAIVKEMRSRFGAIIANGQGTMKGKIFRLAHLGYYDALELFAGLAGVEIALVKLGHKCELGSGVRAAQKVYMEHAG